MRVAVAVFNLNLKPGSGLHLDIKILTVFDISIFGNEKAYMAVKWPFFENFEIDFCACDVCKYLFGGMWGV